MQSRIASGVEVRNGHCVSYHYIYSRHFAGAANVPVASSCAGVRLPLTPRFALPGVTRVAVSCETLEAVVTFDDAKANDDAPVKATTDASNPSTVNLARKVVRNSR